MATSFPTSLDSLTNPSATDTLDSPPHDEQHADANDAIEALQAKVGVDSSAVTSSLDYKVAQLEAISHGKILQVVSTTKTDTFSASITSGTSSAVTGLTVDITPSSTSNKILVQVMLSGAVGVADRAGVILTRGGSAISGAIADADGSRGRVTGGLTDREFDPNTSTFVYLDSPASTSALTYGVDLYSVYTVTHYVNRGQNNDDQNYRFRAVSTITVMEVSA
jgi:hypothetical protein